MTENCNIIAGGDPFSRELYDRYSYPGAFVICADRGYEYAAKLGLEHDLIMGDFDSASSRPEGAEVMTFPVEKDDTDTMLAVKEGLSRGYKHFRIFGATGGRLDHTIGNIQTLKLILDSGGSGELISEDQYVTLLGPGTYEIDGRDGFSLSLFAYSDMVEGLCVSGCKYNAEDMNVQNNSTLTMSNAVKGEKARVSFRRGALLVVCSRL